MSLKVFSLNIECNKHFERWPQVIRAEQPDLVCLQEVFETDMPYISEQLGMSGSFSPMLDVSDENKYSIPIRGKWGIGYFTNLEITQPVVGPDLSAIEHTSLPSGLKVFYYSGSSDIKKFVGPNDASRIFVVGTVTKDGQQYTVGTTHFTWSGDGQATQEQHQDQHKFLQILQQFPDLIFCGDFNAPRGGEIFSEFEKHFTDNLPKDVTTTIDLELHYAAPLYLVVDTIFSTPHYRVSNVRAVSGLSDHIGVVGEVIHATI